MTKKQKFFLWTAIVIILLIAFLWYYFRNRKKGEKCPDGRPVPASGNCADNPILVDSGGNTIVTPVTPDNNGCIPPSSYVVNSFPLGLGQKGDLVRQLQTRLNIDFNANLQEDGFFGCNTLNAVLKNYLVGTVDAELFKEKVQGIITTPLGIPAQSVYETPTI